MTLTNQKDKLFPGMLDAGVEFFAVEGKLKFIKKGKVQKISKLSKKIRKLTKEEIAKNPTVANALNEWFPNSQKKRQAQFLTCRYGGIDCAADISNKEFKKGDYWECPNRSSCKFNGIICQAPSYNGHRLAYIEIQLMKLTSSVYTNEVIAEKLELAYGTFHKLKQALYAKLGIQTKQEVALIAKSLNII